MATQGRRRAFGQHFLKNAGMASEIANAALEGAQQWNCRDLMEIGPGLGAITQPLLEGLAHFSRIERFLLVEKDRTLASNWMKKEVSIPQSCSLLVESADFLLLPEEKWLQRTPLAVVSNLPYSVGTAILDRLARRPDVIPVMVLMFQAEVAKRLRAEASTKERGSLSLWIQNRWDVKKLLAVPPQAFTPPPEVNSEVVVLTHRSSPQVEGTDTKEGNRLWESLLKGSFAHRRKMLRSSFPWRNALEQSGVDGTKRPEALEWPEWRS